MLFQPDKFMHLVAHDKSLAIKLIALFKDEWPQILKEIKKAIQDKNNKNLESHSHRIKGNVRNFYADSLAQLAEHFETRGKQGLFDNLAEEIKIFEINLKNLEAELENYMREKLT